MMKRNNELTAHNVFEFPRAQSIVVSGDIHGDFTQLVFKCCDSKLDAIDKIICAIDTVITHTSPSFCELSSHQGLHEWAEHDLSLIEDVERERKVMDQIHDYLYVKNHPLQNWYYGHFHQTWHAEIEGIKYNMLDCMELREIW